MNPRLTTELPDHTAAAATKRQVLLTLATAAALLGGALGIARAQAKAGAQSAGRTDAPVSTTAPSTAPAQLSAAYRTTYYLVDSQQQATRVQAELESATEEAARNGTPPAPSRVVVISSPEEQAALEAGENECAAQPGCQVGAVVRIPDEP